jgi:hypothetical protein
MTQVQTTQFENAGACLWTQAHTFDLDAELFKILALAKSAFAPTAQAQASAEPYAEADWSDLRPLASRRRRTHNEMRRAASVAPHAGFEYMQDAGCPAGA